MKNGMAVNCTEKW